MCLHVHMSVRIHKWRGQKKAVSSVFFSLSPNVEFSNWIKLAVQQAPGVSCLCLLSTGITGICFHAQLFMGVLESNSCPHVCITDWTISPSFEKNNSEKINPNECYLKAKNFHETIFFHVTVDVCLLWSLRTLLCGSKELKKSLYPSYRPTHRGNYVLWKRAGSIWDTPHCPTKGVHSWHMGTTAELPMSLRWGSQERIIWLKMGLVLH